MNDLCVNRGLVITTDTLDGLVIKDTLNGLVIINKGYSDGLVDTIIMFTFVPYTIRGVYRCINPTEDTSSQVGVPKRLQTLEQKGYSRRRS